MNQSRIIINPDILSGKPHVRGTQLTVAEILDSFVDGNFVNNADSPNPLEAEDVLACFQ
jgi:uncharacterized protein (DUF433 family)